MKKLIFLLLLLPFFVEAQYVINKTPNNFTAANGNVFTGGNIGIGTPTPAYGLELTKAFHQSLISHSGDTVNIISDTSIFGSGLSGTMIYSGRADAAGINVQHPLCIVANHMESIGIVELIGPGGIFGLTNVGDPFSIGSAHYLAVDTNVTMIVTGNNNGERYFIRNYFLGNGMLPVKDTVTGGLFPLFRYDTRKGTNGQVLTYRATGGTPTPPFWIGADSTYWATPIERIDTLVTGIATAGTFNTPDNYGTLILAAGTPGAIATYTIALPANPIEGQVLNIYLSNCTIGTLSFTGNGHSVSSNLATGFAISHHNTVTYHNGIWD